MKIKIRNLKFFEILNTVLLILISLCLIKMAQDLESIVMVFEEAELIFENY